MLQKDYGGIIWTKHALQRLAERGLSQKMAWTAFQYPESSVQLDSTGTMQYQRSFGSSIVTIVAKKNDRRQWLIISCWIDPPLANTIEIKRKTWYSEFNRAGFWKKFFMEIRRAITGRDY